MINTIKNFLKSLYLRTPEDIIEDKLGELLNRKEKPDPILPCPVCGGTAGFSHLIVKDGRWWTLYASLSCADCNKGVSMQYLCFFKHEWADTRKEGEKVPRPRPTKRVKRAKRNPSQSELEELQK